jgi:ribokinase
MGANKWIDRPFVEQAEPLIAQSDVVLSVLEIPVQAACTAMELGRKHGVRTVLNPAPAIAIPKDAFRSIDLLTPNETELRILLGLEPDDATPTAELASQLQREYGPTVIVTRGEHGSLLLTKEDRREFPAVPVKVVDTTGAGDAFTAALAVALAEGKDIATAIRFATCSGAFACTRLGVIPSLGHRTEIDKLFDQHFTH